MNRTIRRGLLYGAAAAVLAGGVWLWNTHNKSDGGERRGGPGPQALHVAACIVKKNALTDNLQVTGSLKPDEEVDLAFEVPGKVTAIYFKEGSRVHKGQLLARVNDAPLQAQLKKLQSQMKLAEDRVYRQQTLLQKEAVSKEALEEVETELATLKADIELVKANIRQTQLVAPFDGVVGLRQISVGTYAATSTVVARLTKTTPLKLEFTVPERYSNELRIGAPVTFKLEGEEHVLHAQVYAMDSHVDNDTRTLAIRALFQNTGGHVKPGRYAQVQLEKETLREALSIPSEAIIPEMGKDKVFVYRSGKAVPVEIHTGLRTEHMVQVVSGLEAGDTLITTGTMQLRTDMDVVLDQITDNPDKV